MKMEPDNVGSVSSSKIIMEEKRSWPESSWVSSCKTRLNAQDLRTLVAEETAKLEDLEEKKRAAEGKNESIRKQEALSLFESVNDIAAKVAMLKTQGVRLLKGKLPSKVERPDIYAAVEDIKVLESAAAYLVVKKYLKDLSDTLEANLGSGLHSEAVDVLQVMTKIQERYFRSTSCCNLKSYVSGTVNYWNQVLLTKFKTEFEKSLEAFGWPSKLAVVIPTLECQKKLHNVVHNLIRLTALNHQIHGSLPEDCSRTVPLLEEFQGRILPVTIMVEPLKKRFYFHFFTNKITNDLRRPEWYFTQIKSWLRQLSPFVKSHVEISDSQIGVSSVYDFAVQLCAMLILKANSHLGDAPEIDDDIFAKILEEAIILENEVAALLNEDGSVFTGTVPPVVSALFSQPSVLQRWLAIEKKMCLEKMDDLFASPSAWSRAVFPGPSEVADLFLALLRFVTDRFAYLRRQSDRAIFLQLLVDLIDDFRVRCLQTWTSKQQMTAEYHDEVLIDYIIADTLHIVRETLNSWEDLPFFSMLSAYMSDFNAHSKGDSAKNGLVFGDQGQTDPAIATNEVSQEALATQGVFFNVLDLYGCLLDTMLESWCDAVISNLKTSIQKDYSARKWHMFPPNGFQENGETLSESILVVVQCLKAVCAGISMSMNSSLCQNWIKRLAVEFDEMFLKSFVYRNRFTAGAIAQIKFDMVYGVFPIFADSNISVSLFLVGINSALRVWEMPQGKALLLRDTLKDSNTTYEFREDTLAELEISLNPSDVIRLLQSRMDLDI